MAGDEHRLKRSREIPRRTSYRDKIIPKWKNSTLERIRPISYSAPFNCRQCEPQAKQSNAAGDLDCFVAPLLAMMGWMAPSRHQFAKVGFVTTPTTGAIHEES